MSPATRAPEPAAVVLVDPINDDARALWHAVLDLAEQLPEDGWCLVGGLMVQLHAYRYEQRGVRPTQDVDVLADSRMRPRSLTEVIAERLLDLGYEVAQPASAIDPPTICRFEREGATIDVLGPDGMKGTPPKTVGGFQTIQVPGGTQALARTESVEIRVGDGRTGFVRCPNLAVALLLKARVLRVAKGLRDQDRGDLVLLLACAEDPILIREHMTNSERGWLRKGAERLRIDEDDLADLFTSEQLARARAAFSLITAT
ncbi:MAG: hypothetical protein WB761_11750 [Solirubrobacteraceae bacterium]